MSHPRKLNFYRPIHTHTLTKNPLAHHKNSCLFPNGPDCVRNGKKNAQGLVEFVEPANSPATPEQRCCVFPGFCGNGDGGQKCVFVGKEGRADLKGKNVIVKRYQA